MCGIVGKLDLDGHHPVDADLVGRMLDVIRHRGPDGSGVHIDGAVGIGHCRLSIIDLSNAGAQPMSNEDDTVWITFNGEIYNYLELREALVRSGHVFKSTTDTEVIIHLYEERGTDCLKSLRGMFAFAIWDKRRNRLFVARDRVGIKPLYYCQNAGAFWFASEFKSILIDPEAPRDIGTQGIRRFLSFYYPAGEETLFRSIKKLLPGHYLVAENGTTKITRYWDLHFGKERWALSFEEATEELRELLQSTVRSHMVADVPVGILLSGGMDSSAVLNFAVQAASRRVKTFTVGFDEGRVVDERPYARIAAQHFGTEHHDMTISSKDFWEFLPAYLWHMEEPVCEPPAVALYYVSRFASSHVKVLLSGEGGDEAFAGYPTYPHMMHMNRLGEALGFLAGTVGSVGSLAGQLSRDDRLHRFSAALGRSFSDYYFSRSSGPTFFFNLHARELLTADFLAQTRENPAEFVDRFALSLADQPLLNKMLYIDSKTWLPDDLLIKADKITMANSIELRVPLLDHEVLEFAASLPPDHKVSARQTKRILKAAFAKSLPAEILNRQKAGFPVPYASWLRNGFSGPMRDVLLSSRSRQRGYFRPGKIEGLLKSNREDGRFARELFSLLILELWHCSFVDRQPASGAAETPAKLS